MAVFYGMSSALLTQLCQAIQILTGNALNGGYGICTEPLMGLAIHLAQMHIT